MNREPVFTWRGQAVKTVGDLTDALHGVVARNNPDEAEWFLNRYRSAVGESADENVGYCLGYLNKKMMVTGLRLFGVQHPYFGSADEAKRVTPRQALLLGMEAGKATAIDNGIDTPDPRPKRKRTR